MKMKWSSISLRLVGWCSVLLLVSTQSWGQRACPPSYDFTEGLSSDFGRTGNRWTNCVGTYTLPDGSKYVGAFQFGQFFGQGTYIFPDGSEYVGEFRNDTFNGQGTLTRADGSVLEGIWENGDLLDPQVCPGSYNPVAWTECVGTVTLAGGREYVGEFRDGEPNGQGTYALANGEQYVGTFRDGQFNGQGTHTYPDGSKYVGEFADSKYNGQGIMTSPDGSVLEGIWDNGEFLGSN